jgi:hypothetical protein
MNHQHREQFPPPLSLELQIDRLVDGELHGSDRRGLLCRLESEAGGWRLCALAFLQAQCWRESVAVQTDAGVTQSPPEQQTGRVRRWRWRRAAQVAGLAASLAATFAFGWIVRDSSPARSGDAVMAHSDTEPPGRAQAPQQFEPNLQAMVETAREGSSGQPSALAPLVKQWEQRGFLAETQTRRASVKLLDGRRVEVPVHEVRLKYVRDRTY